MDDQLLSVGEIQAVDDTEFAVVPVPEWGGNVRIRGLTGAERDRYEASIVDDRGKGMKVTLKDARARLVVMAAVDAQGKRLFSDQKGAIVWLSGKSARALNRVVEKVRELSGMTEQDEDDILGNSERAGGDDSPSGSQGISE